MFRLEEDRALINRFGFNSIGSEKVLENVKKFNSERSKHKKLVLGVNIGKNKLSEGINDYAIGMRTFYQVADYLVINISSPNTPNLRFLQRKEELTNLLNVVMGERQIQMFGHAHPSGHEVHIKPYKPILVKVL